MKYDIQTTNLFKKDLKRAKKQKRNFNKLLAIIEILINGGVLPLVNKDHILTGNYNNYRECHIEPDWLLIY